MIFFGGCFFSVAYHGIAHASPNRKRPCCSFALFRFCTTTNQLAGVPRLRETAGGEGSAPAAAVWWPSSLVHPQLLMPPREWMVSSNPATLTEELHGGGGHHPWPRRPLLQMATSGASSRWANASAAEPGNGRRRKVHLTRRSPPGRAWPRSRSSYSAASCLDGLAWRRSNARTIGVPLRVRCHNGGRGEEGRKGGSKDGKRQPG